MEAENHDINQNAKFQELEDLVYRMHTKESRAVSTISDIVGVLSNIKPTALIDISDDADKIECKRVLNNNGLSAVFSYNQRISSSGKLVFHNVVFVAKNFDNAVKLSEKFKELWSLIDDASQILYHDRWEKCTYEIGKMLGYPETAIKYFLERSDDKIYEEDNKKRMNRNRYYAHSPKNEDAEFLQYDHPLNLAIEKWSQKTAKIMKLDTEKRW